MTYDALLRLIPLANPTLLHVLAAKQPRIAPPIRSEIFGQERFAQHGHSLALTHRAGKTGFRSSSFFPRLRSNIAALRAAHSFIGLQVKAGYDISPAAEWLLDNFHLIEAQLNEIHEGLPWRYFRALPVLLDEPLAGLPRVYGIAWAFVAHTDGAFDPTLLTVFLLAYQENRELNLNEIWALPTTLRVVLIENLRRLAERIARNKAARELANVCCDHIQTYSHQKLDQILKLLVPLGVAEVFLAQMSQRLQDLQNTCDPAYHEWMSRCLPDAAAVRTQQSANLAADNVSVSNAVRSLRAIGDADWPTLIAHTSTLMLTMLQSPVFEAEHQHTRDQSLHAIELLAQHLTCPESIVAQTLLALMAESTDTHRLASVPGYWLQGAGRSILKTRLGQPDSRWQRSMAFFTHHMLPVYLLALAIGTSFIMWWLVHLPAPLHTLRFNHPVWFWLASFALLFPASETVIAIVNRLISESTPPQRLPRLALLKGLDVKQRTLVVIPSLLNNTHYIDELVHRLQRHYLANQESQVQFALLTDWPDANTAHIAGDDALLAHARHRIHELNLLYPLQASEKNRFLLLHRPRTFSTSEQCWIGWERKRGKLEQLINTIANPRAKKIFFDLDKLSDIAPQTVYLMTLDSDTELPPGRLRELVGIAAHPHNQPCLSADNKRVVAGYGILQPRIATPLASPQQFTRFHWLFAGQCGVDPYSAATSEIYQDIFGEGTFIGKGLLHIHTMQTVLSQRLPHHLILSHDLLEGAIARCAAVTDVTLIEDSPFHADVAASRIHRWTRGDWQLLSILFQPKRYPLKFIHRWKMIDNLRRSLVAPMSLLGLSVSLAGLSMNPTSILLLVSSAYCAGPLMGTLAGVIPSRSQIAKRYFYQQAWQDIKRVVGGGLWHMAQLSQHSLLAIDAILRALYRMNISHRHLLEWLTAESANQQAQQRLLGVCRLHWQAILLPTLLILALFTVPTPFPFLTSLLCVIWAASPVWTWWVSRTKNHHKSAILSVVEGDYLEGIARDTWRFFERCVNEENHHLPPDNLQTRPHDMVAYRTSPTNIGLYLLSTTCARQFGWIGTQAMITRLQATLTTMQGLNRYQGHFYNWYDTRTCLPLTPVYVSTVDSGNLSGHLLAVAQACLELASQYSPSVVNFDNHVTSLTSIKKALAFTTNRLIPLKALWPTLQALLPHGNPINTLLLSDDVLITLSEEPERFLALLNDTKAELDQLNQSLESYDVVIPAVELVTDTSVFYPTGFIQADTPAMNAKSSSTHNDDWHTLIWLITDYVTTMQSACLDLQKKQHQAQLTTYQQLKTLATLCENMAWEADYHFLYNHRRHLFHIGFRVAEQELDASFYDLLASESRLTSLLAIAKGDIPMRHWSSLGRPFFVVTGQAGLRSWSGSMFEYLMPSLMLQEPFSSVLHQACHSAIIEQMTFTQLQQIPWGISESAYAGNDHTLAYQYAPQGVPKLALRRTPTDELVIAPYATALASQLTPHLACLNFMALEKYQARGQYGFIEAIDFTLSRQLNGEVYTRVMTYMAHHQGMSIVALANVLHDGVVQRWGMSNQAIQAVNSLLHERPPREISQQKNAIEVWSQQPSQRRSPGLLRHIVPGTLAVEPTHLLSNGRYTVALRSNGSGWSRRGQNDITRSRDDALRDAYGSFLYIRFHPQANLVSLTQHPAADPEADYSSLFHADRVCFNTTWDALKVRTSVWVSPEDDIEFRMLELRNLTDKTLEIEIISAFDMTLSNTLADAAHPAFSNLFIQAEWHASHRALLFNRQPRLETEQPFHAAHFLAHSDANIMRIGTQTDRQQWLGRYRNAAMPAARMHDMTEGEPQDQTLDTGLDPVCVMAIKIKIAPYAKSQLTFATTASDNPTILRAVIDKYQQRSYVQRASLMSTTLAGIRLRDLRITPDNLAAIQTLTTALIFSLTRPQREGLIFNPSQPMSCDRRLLWRLGISGDRPLMLVKIGLTQGLGMVRSLTQALRLWSWAGLACDLVIIDSEPASYYMNLQHELMSLCKLYETDSQGQNLSTVAHLYVLKQETLSANELSTMKQLAHIQLHADGRPLVHHVNEWNDHHEQAFTQRFQQPHQVYVDSWQSTHRPMSSLSASSITGKFIPLTGEFEFLTGLQQYPKRPWMNVLSNPEFGTQIAESGSGYTWAINSRLNQLTAWSNDPVSDPASEYFYIENLHKNQLWRIAAPCHATSQQDPFHHPVEQRVIHGQGYTFIQQRCDDIDITTSWCVDIHQSVKQVQLQLINRGKQPISLRLTGIAEWMMGSQRHDRHTISTKHEKIAFSTSDKSINLLLATQHEAVAGFAEGTAFLAVLDNTVSRIDWTCDRRELFNDKGQAILPDTFGQRSGTGLDPCAVFSITFTLKPDETVERTFLIGYACNPIAARQLAIDAVATSAAQRLLAIKTYWQDLLSATVVITPDPLFDAMVNHWLLYQSVACRLWAKAGFYQAGGATGFRDQLQDAMALVSAAPHLLHQQIRLCASRQFIEGDVQHWWHAPLGAGVRTHFSDDLLWLPFACAHYCQSTGDLALLDISVPFIEGDAIPEGAEDAYYTPTISLQQASIYEHAARTIDRSLAVGEHGLPLMGTGDWNDGMNRVGHAGRGESVWLAWFIDRVVSDFTPLAIQRGDTERVQRWQAATQGWRQALNHHAWDGAWYKRAFFDNGEPLGSQLNQEAQIDLIAQAWSVLSHAAPIDRQIIAMQSAHTKLVDSDYGLIKLLDPPLIHQQPSAGYIQAYPAGVRENGGQYSHAAVWALMAQAQLPVSASTADRVYQYFTYLSPAHRSLHPVYGALYGLEPYVMAGDVYSQPPYTGRGGWSWYTGAAGWLHRAAIESLFGLHETAQTLTFTPCLPTHWPQAELTLKRDGYRLRFIFYRGDEATALSATQADGATLLPVGQSLQRTTLVRDACFVVPLFYEDAPKNILI